jgi:hypothetical protein
MIYDKGMPLTRHVPPTSCMSFMRGCGAGMKSSRCQEFDILAVVLRTSLPTCSIAKAITLGSGMARLKLLLKRNHFRSQRNAKRFPRPEIRAKRSTVLWRLLSADRTRSGPIHALRACQGAFQHMLTASGRAERLRTSAIFRPSFRRLSAVFPSTLSMLEANFYLAYLCSLTESTASLTPHPPELVPLDPLDICHGLSVSFLMCKRASPSVRCDYQFCTSAVYSHSCISTVRSFTQYNLSSILQFFLHMRCSHTATIYHAPQGCNIRPVVLQFTAFLSFTSCLPVLHQLPCYQTLSVESITYACRY